MKITEIGCTCGDDDDTAGVARVHEIAFVDEADTGAAVKRRDDGRVAEDGGRVLDRRDV